MLEAISRSESCWDSVAKESLSERERPIVWPSMMPLTESDSCTIEVIADSLR